ncbi:TetR/AcrR family transcriptional regulator [Kitasatospora sp. DSM 101779]|uniref:TetR/AcrR family transcriptional regulator n=1 Tax=Kitasatospora sp. DSM 101779 TaxID=2853165 RepID=UPI0021DB497D|nr:TetR/AcrR family transcriptional regulator [Kitasatospora sp. DSM 101779]MCU7822001.1 TetR/AcrR family transcriptional regulator [Kitasatospora sp. DSM 101779]
MADKPRDPAVSIWVAPPRERRRGSAPAGLSRERIVRAAVGLLDADGVQAFSMRKLAAALDVTPMSVYWYVDNKDELLELALDEAFGDMRIPPLGDGDDWRAHLRLLAHEYRRCLHEHPWAAQLAGQFLALGPNSLFFSTSAIGAIRRTGLTGEQLGGALGLVLQFVYGFALAESQWLQRVRASGLHEDELNRVVRGVAERADARFLDNADLLPPTEEGGLRASRDSQFEAGLAIALAGIDATVAAGR